MACEGKIYKGDIGTLIKTTVSECQEVLGVPTDVPLDLSLGTITMRFRKPDFTILTVNAVYSTDGTDGMVQHTSVLGDFDQAGEYQFQVFVTTPQGSWSTDTQTFTVYNTIG